MTYKVVQEIERLTLRYIRTGGKKNREVQRKRMIIFGTYCAKKGARSFAQVGKNHVASFFKENQFAESTRYSYAIGIRELFEISNRPVNIPACYLKPPSKKEEIPLDRPETTTEATQGVG